MTRIYVAPAPGKILRDPQTNIAIPQAGKGVLKSPYWTRRLQCGDAILLSEGDAPTKTKADPVQKKATGKKDSTAQQIDAEVK